MGNTGFANSMSYGWREGTWNPNLEYSCLPCEGVVLYPQVMGKHWGDNKEMI